MFEKKCYVVEREHQTHRFLGLLNRQVSWTDSTVNAVKFADQDSALKFAEYAKGSVYLALFKVSEVKLAKKGGENE
jgi:hypothetical protein